MVSLLSVCKSSHDWILPLLYRTITLWRAEQISKLYALHNVEEQLLARFRYIQHLWIGSTPRHHGDLTYGSSSWPVTILDRIFNACTNLQSLYIVNFDQNQWFRLEDAIPASLENLAMGPIHGPFRINEMKHKPRIRNFTSAQTYMRDDEVQNLVFSPYLSTFRRFIPPNQAQSFSCLDQAACVSKSPTLHEMRLVFCGPINTPITLQEAYLKKVTSDARVVISMSDYENWMTALYAEFQAEEDEYVALLSRST